MKFLSWTMWLLITIMVGGFYAYTLFLDESKEELLIGEASHGHFQIELACSSCHTDAFGGKEVLQDACIACHGNELELSQDSHPRKKFSDPRNAERLIGIDARYCVSCHTEHQEEHTNLMGVTIQEDYCVHCHNSIAEERASHQNLGFETCASAGCHNYHDNRALYETFLAHNANQPWLSDTAAIPLANNAALTAHPTLPHQSFDFQNKSAEHPAILAEWSTSAHANAGVNCGSCHSEAANGESFPDAKAENWVASPSFEVCATCHGDEADTFLNGKHGMRLAADLTPLDARDARLEFQNGAGAHNGCNNCHQPHDSNRQFAAVDACLGCHSDEHSIAFNTSPHANTVQTSATSVLNKESHSTSRVTCATCHMPSLTEDGSVLNTHSGTQLAKDNNIERNSESETMADKKISIVRVNHNQNDNLRPNEKMIRPVCMQCHSLEFSINSLADPELIKNNFTGKPNVDIPSIDWALKNQGHEK